MGSVSGLLALGAFSDFIPAPFLSGRAWIAPMLLLGSGLTVSIVAPAYRIGGWKAVVGKQLFNTVMALCLAPPLLGLLCWLVLARGGSWVYTRIAGVDFEETHVMQTAAMPGARACKYRLSGGPLAHRFPGHLCIDEAQYRRHPEQRVSVLLRGQRSVLGMRIASISDVP
ncbi:hypothetical protein XarbCFBP8150_01410 [Xanthomonas arboricola]|uniref:hypothetical protein n=1 Tax=Xanthomonas arboricola TaxID=56448 RepID=UPI000CEEA1EC|nr:hypothetical protein [Xanthomonas arboricola]PPT73113.1 hypothetical protein XarbCFBP8150_01410 [Xanthomonas arboricola]